MRKKNIKSKFIKLLKGLKQQQVYLLKSTFVFVVDLSLSKRFN